MEEILFNLLSNDLVLDIKSPNPDVENHIKIRWNSNDHAFEIVEVDTDIIVNTKQMFKVLYYHEE